MSTIQIDRLLETCVKRKASDLHLVVGKPPVLRMHGHMRELQTKVLEAEARAGTKRVVVAAPGFAADCLETLEELAIRGKEQFLAAGGEDYATLACLNAGDTGMDMLEALVRRELGGWI